jgi:hypothetical protein
MHRPPTGKMSMACKEKVVELSEIKAQVRPYLYTIRDAICLNYLSPQSAREIHLQQRQCTMTQMLKYFT